MADLLAVVHVLGMMLMFFGITYVPPLAVSALYGDGTLVAFGDALLINVMLGFLLWFTTRRFRRELKPRDGYMLVVLSWSGMASFATLPLLLAIPGLSFTHAYFETMSALTTTGATVLVGLDNLPQALNFWRHELQWLGGMGIIVLAVAILPLLGVGGRQLFMAETPGPMKDSKMTPRIAETAKNLWMVYFGITLACIVALRLAGMSWFDAVNHAFAAMSLGGFSTHDASIGYFNSPAIEAVLIVFMLVAAINFASHFTAWREKSLAPYAHDPEAWPVLALVLGSCLVAGWYLWWQGTYEDFWTALRHASFNLVSIATDCGFASVDFDKWPIVVPLWMLFLSCITVSSGSTGGGIKMVRTLALYRQAQREMIRLLHPQAIQPLRLGSAVIPNNVVFSILGFIFLYFMSIATACFALMASGLDFITSLSAVIAWINNMGPGLGKVGPAGNFAGLTDLQLWIGNFTMLLGRLEVFTLLILFNPVFWRK